MSDARRETNFAPPAGEISFAGKMAGAIDLLVDFATLGEYGLEAAPADGRCEQDGLRAAWEALAPSRRGSCRRPSPTRSARAGVDG